MAAAEGWLLFVLPLVLLLVLFVVPLVVVFVLLLIPRLAFENIQL